MPLACCHGQCDQCLVLVALSSVTGVFVVRGNDNAVHHADCLATGRCRVRCGWMLLVHNRAQTFSPPHHLCRHVQVLPRSFDAMVAEQHHSSAGLSAPTSDVEASLRRDAQRWIAAGGRELWRCEKAQGLQLRHVTVAKPLTRRSCASTVWTCGLL